MAQLPRKSTPRPAGKRRQHGHQQRARQLPQLQKKKKKKKNNARPGAQSAAAEPVNQAAALSDKPPRNAVPALAGTRRDQGEAERRAVCPASDGASEKKEKADKRRKLSTKAGGRGQVFADSAESLLRFAATAARAEEKRLESKLERLEKLNEAIEERERRMADKKEFKKRKLEEVKAELRLTKKTKRKKPHDSSEAAVKSEPSGKKVTFAV